MAQRLVSGGYLLGKPSVRGDWHTAHLVPERILSASGCLTDRFPDFELFGGTGPEDEAFALRHLDQPCNPNELPTLRARLWKMVREGRLEYAEIFLSVAAAREVLPCLGTRAEEYTLFGISTTPKHARAMIDAEQGKTYCHTAVLAREMGPEDGEILGWEPLGTDFSDFHSWYCCGIERHAEEAFGIRPNSHGFIDTLADAERVAAYCNETQPEPGYWAPWRITRYPL